MDADGIRTRLRADRQAAVARTESMAADYQQIVAASRDSNADDEHDPEGATIAFERSQAAELLSRARQSVSDLDRALARLDTGEYGRCEVCGAPIGDDRLVARPASTTCIRCARRS